MNSKKITLLLTSILVISLVLFFHFRGETKTEVSAETKTINRSSSRNALTLESERAFLAKKADIPYSVVDKCMLDILKAYETGDYDQVTEVIMRWLEDDEDALLNALVYLAGPAARQNMSIPFAKIADHLRKKYSNEGAINVLALYPEIADPIASVISSIMTSWAGENLDEALGYFRENPNFNRFTYFRKFTTEAIKNPEHVHKVVDFFEGLDPEDSRKSGLQLAYGSWLEADPDRFAEHVSDLPETPLIAEYLSQYSSKVASQDIDTAIEWADSIGNDSFRNNAYAHIGSEMLNQDPERFDQWKANLSFQDETTKKIFEHTISSLQESSDYENVVRQARAENLSPTPITESTQ